MEELKTMLLRDNKKSKQNKLNEEKEKKEKRKWENIPDDMLEEIMKRLALKDYIGLSTICSPWKATVTNAIANKHCQPLPEFPLILLQSKNSGFFNLSTEREHRMKKPLLASTKTCHGTIEGWLILSEYSENGLSIFFFNPVTNDRVIIPTKWKSPTKKDGLLMGKIVASSKPNSYGTSNCYLVGLLNDYCHIAIYEHFNKSWSMLEADKDSRIYFMDVEVIGTMLYVKTDVSSFSIMVYDLKDCIEDDPILKPKLIAKLPEIGPLPISTRTGNQRTAAIGCFAKDELGELYLIYMICNAEYETETIGGYLSIVKEFVKAPQITSVQVFKFDMMSKKTPNEWWKRMSLENHVVFYGFNNMVFSKGALNWNEDRLFRGNCLYFAFSYPCPKDDPWSSFQLGMFCMTDNSTKYFPLERSNHPSVPYPFWFIPSIS